MSAIEIKKYNRLSMLQEHESSLLKQADAWYLQKHFRIEKGFNQSSMMKSLILKEVLGNTNCGVVNFLNKKIRGALGDENLQIADLNTLETQYRDINNYYYNTTNNEWDLTEW